MSTGARTAVVYAAGAIVAAVVVIGVMLVATGRQSEARVEGERRVTEVAAGPRVMVVTAGQSPPERRIELQAEARPWAQVTLYAKVSGYLKTIKVDKGDHVKRGQLLAFIESPELDSQFQAAVADWKFKQVNARRSTSLAKPGVVAERDAELARSAADVARATVRSLADQKAYESIHAPLDGQVIARFADPGALVQNAASASTGALPIVTVAQTARLRVTAYLDQRDAPWVHAGDLAEVAVPDRPAVRVVGKVARATGQLDPRTRTMLIEVDVNNASGAIVPGSFVTVSLKAKMPSMVEVPAGALVLRGRSPFVAVVGGDGRVHYKAVVVGEDDGATARIRSGLAAGERVAIDLGDAVPDGAQVQAMSIDAGKKK